MSDKIEKQGKVASLTHFSYYIGILKITEANHLITSKISTAKAILSEVLSGFFFFFGILSS